MKLWHKIIDYKSHMNSGKDEERTIFAYAHDVIDALRFYRELNGFKKNQIPLEVSLLSKEKQGELEKVMIETGVNIEHAKKIGYFPEPFFNLETPKI